MRLYHNIIIGLMGLAIALLVAGCVAPDPLADQDEGTAEELYNAALEEVATGDIALASPLFDEVERQHPYSRLATQAQLMSAWALYQSNNYAAAVPALNRFIDLNPAHPEVAYAYYLKAQSYYEQIVDVERDANMTLLAKESFEALLNRFPQSRYARDARLKLDLTNSHLAGKEMAVGRFYLGRGHYGAALRRFTKVIRDYEQSSQVPEALFRMMEGYLALGLDTEAERSAAVLQYNYPDSGWTERMRGLIANPEANPDPGIFERLQKAAGEVF